MFFLTPKYLKQGRLYLKEAKKRLAYHRDLWSPGIIADFDEVVEALQKGIKDRNKEAIQAAQASLEGLCARHCPRGADAWIGENVEVILVAIIVALGIRTYILQPFTIPTSSMYPTLCGIMSKRTEAEPPSLPVRLWEKAAYGRTYHDVVALADEVITKVEETKWMVIFTYTRIETSARNTYWVNESIKDVQETWPVQGGVRFQKGEPIVRGYTDTGDHVFVDKISYNFRTPKRGEVFVFTTADIAGQGSPGAPPRQPSQFYIKRLAGVPGDTLRIDAPKLFINGQLATEDPFRRVIGMANRYPGYTNPPRDKGFLYLTSPEMTFAVEPGQYFALGDNSPRSSDSRAWGTVPAANLMGTGFFVYWPFRRDEGTHFGVIH